MISSETACLYMDLTCSICLNEFQAGDMVRKLVCRHYFHHDCIKMWIVRQTKCPNCKINPISGEYEAQSSSEDEQRERNRQT